MRRVLLTLTVAAAAALMAVPAEAQLNFGVQGSVITAVDDIPVSAGDELALSGTFGVGGRLIVSPPVFPISLVGSADYYLVDCPTGVDCSLWTAQGHVTLGLPLPVVRPYVLGGVQYRKDQVDSTTGAVVGAGVQFNFVVSVFVEGQFELADPVSGLGSLDVGTPFVLKGGLVF